MTRNDPDPITFTVIWNGVLSVAELLGVTLRHTAFSEAVREGDDFSSAVFDRHGRMIAQGNFSPGHLGAMPSVVESVRDYFRDGALQPGDSVMLNDSFLCAGHFPDIYQVMPVFLDDALIGYVCTSAHHVDVGGAAPGSQKVHGVTESFQEGLRLLPVRFVRGGQFDPDIMRIVLGNVRMVEKVRGDLSAQHNANLSGAERLRTIFRDFGQELVERTYELILDRSEVGMREALAKVPNGIYSFEDYLDDYGPNTSPIKMAVDIDFHDGEVTVDFSRSDDQVPAAINSYINYTRAYTYFAMKVFCNPLQPQNAGGMRPIKLVAREGSFLNPIFPAPSGGRAIVQIRIFDTINGAMAKALPKRAMGAFSHWSNPNIGGVNDRTGKPFVMYDVGLAGYGGRADKDGAEALTPVMNCSNIPVEVHEALNPLLVRRLELIRDSGGAGKFRGGCGLRKDIELRNSSALMTLLGDRHTHAPYGVFGGHPGRKAETLLQRDGTEERLASKAIVELRRGDVVSFRLSGAGGYGDPRERDPEAVWNDIADDYVSPEVAREIYGVLPDTAH